MRGEYFDSGTLCIENHSQIPYASSGLFSNCNMEFPQRILNNFHVGKNNVTDSAGLTLNCSRRKASKTILS